MLRALKQTGPYTEEDYYGLPENIHAELIDGQFYNMAAPGRIHQEILGALHFQIYQHILSKNGPCKVYPAPFAVKLFHHDKTIVEPDISVICKPERLTEKGCTGAPDWIIEIVSPSNPGHDYVRKLNLYMDAGVREYWIVNPMTNKTAVYCLSEDPGFSMETYSFQDSIKAGIFDDLWIDFREISR